MTNPDEVKDEFYETLHSVIAAVPKAEKLVVLGDFNARRRPQGKKPPRKLNASKLKDAETKQLLVEKLRDKLEAVSLDEQDIETGWKNLRDVIHSAALETLGPTCRNHKDWFDDNCNEIQRLLNEKHRLHRAHLSDTKDISKKDAYTNIRNTVQEKLRQMRDTWLMDKAVEIQGYADKHNLKKFYDGLKEIFGPSSTGLSPLLSADGNTLITDKDDILKRWAEHFDSVLNRPSSINEEAISRLPQVPINEALAEPPSPAETHKAVGQLSSGKAPGQDSIPAEIYKEGGTAVIDKLHQLFTIIWERESIPQDFKDATIIHLYKRKGNRQVCDNHRGISLLSVAGKTLARILLNRLIIHLDQGLLPESQCGFRKDRGTTDMIFAARQLQEKCQEQNSDLFSTYVDLTKAFDSVCREGLWKILAKYGCPMKFINLVRQFHDGMQAHVRDSDALSDPFPVTNGVKQGCVLAPTLFSIMFTAMLTDAFSGGDVGIGIRHRTDGKVFNLRRLQAKTKVKTDIVRDLLFADDCALNAGSEPSMQHSVDNFSNGCNNFGLTISTKKTEVLHLPAPGKPYVEPTITVNNKKLNVVSRFTYLGSTLNQNANIDDEVDSRIAKASATFGRLHDNVWNRRGIRLETKLQVYKAIVLPILLYACETWTVYRRHAKRLNQFHTTRLRKILNIKWQDRIPDTEVLTSAGMPSIYTMLMQSQLRWSGHLVRMPDHRLPKKLFYGELEEGARLRGGQKKRYKDSLKASLKAFDLKTDSWEHLASDRPQWRRAVQKGAVTYEGTRRATAQQKRQARKERAANPPSSITLLPCPHCNRHFRAKIGLYSHLRTHLTT
ncbi:uncharacterized protein LOC118403431 [Branchiostoma floridae]|uniref:Uncharacterized protein LOC118403431 n=1 Tax=Branchiostoma floridae TaxID=7739 RepID=A0A9J7HIW6_BRAFL|nr:uncharacterized protein LOC118403431 [Branchiostoma floridae]